jgi:hypothetical protein
MLFRHGESRLLPNLVKEIQTITAGSNPSRRMSACRSIASLLDIPARGGDNKAREDEEDIAAA